MPAHTQCVQSHRNLPLPHDLRHPQITSTGRSSILTEPPHHHVATEEDYPHERVIRVPSWCAGCGQRMTDGQLVKVMLDRTGKETLWHRPCWDRGKKP